MKQDYIKGFAQKCAEHGVKAKDLLKEAGRGDALMEVIQALKDSYSGSGLQGAIGDIGEGAGEAWDSVAGSGIGQAVGGAGKAVGGAVETGVEGAGEGIMALVEKIKGLIGGGQ